MGDAEWEEVLFHLHQFGLTILTVDRAAGTITVQIPRL